MPDGSGFIIEYGNKPPEQPPFLEEPPERPRGHWNRAAILLCTIGAGVGAGALAYFAAAAEECAHNGLHAPGSCIEIDLLAALPLSFFAAALVGAGFYVRDNNHKRPSPRPEP